MNKRNRSIWSYKKALRLEKEMNDRLQEEIKQLKERIEKLEGGDKQDE